MFVRRPMRPLTGRELWRVGDWGGASRHIGERWEAVGAAALDRLIGQPDQVRPDFIPRAAVSFVHDAGLARAVQSGGLTNADALLIGPLDGRLVLQPVDFKWTIEVARAGQVSAETLEALLEAAIPEMKRAIEARIDPTSWELALPAGLPLLSELIVLDGLFITPEHAANRAFLASPARLRDESPIAAHQVIFEPVDPLDFFAPLPGWSLAEVLAAQDGARRMLQTIEGAEHYYRLGAGVLGALLARKRSIFDPAVPAIDATAELSELRRTRRLTTTAQLVSHLDRVMSARSSLVKQLNGLGRSIYPFAAFRATLKSAGITLPERGHSEERRWSRLYGLSQRELASRLQVEGRALVSSGQSDAQAVATLTSRAAELARAAAEIAARYIAQEQASSTRPDIG